MLDVPSMAEAWDIYEWVEHAVDNAWTANGVKLTGRGKPLCFEVRLLDTQRGLLPAWLGYKRVHIRATEAILVGPVAATSTCLRCSLGALSTLQLQATAPWSGSHHALS